MSWRPLLSGMTIGVGCCLIILFVGRTEADFPSPAATDTLAPHAVLLTCHYIEQLPEKPKTNRELLRTYIEAYKNLEKALTEADESDYRIELIGDDK